MALNPLAALGIKVVPDEVPGKTQLKAPGGATVLLDASELKAVGEQLLRLAGGGAQVANNYAARLMGSSKDARLKRAEDFGNGLCVLAEKLGMSFVADVFGSSCKTSIEACKNDRTLQQGGK